MTAGRTAGPRARRPLVVLRPVPGDSVVHRLWAGTKLLAALALTVTLVYVPSWPGIGVVCATLLVTALLARIPRGVVPTIPWWVFAAMSIGLLINIPSGGTLLYLRSLALGVVLLAASAMIGWTTRLSEIAPAVATLGAPLRLLRLPVDEWAAATALCLRGFPLLLDEFRVLYAARRQRPSRFREHGHPRGGNRINAYYFEIVDILAAAIAVSVRRADELGDAITARGGTGRIAADKRRPGLRDAVALAVVAACCAGIVLLG